MQLTLIINSIVCVVGTFVGILFAGGSIVSIANMRVPWRSFLLIAAMLVPLMFVVSGIGAWLAYGYVSDQFSIRLIALPWCYTMLFILLMLLSFD
jgi:hypothetical protein